MTDQAAADRLMRLIERRIESIVDARLRTKTGVAPGGPYDRVKVDSQGRITWAGSIGILVAAANVSTPQTIANATTTVIDFDNIVSDPSGSISGTGSGWIFTAPATGYYQLLFGNLTDTNTWSVVGREINARYLVNGSGGAYLDRQWPISDSPIALFLQGIAVVSLSVTDTLAITTYQNSGASLQTGNSGNCFIQILSV